MKLIRVQTMVEEDGITLEAHNIEIPLYETVTGEGTVPWEIVGSKVGEVIREVLSAIGDTPEAGDQGRDTSRGDKNSEFSVKYGWYSAAFNALANRINERATEMSLSRMEIRREPEELTDTAYEIHGMPKNSVGYSGELLNGHEIYRELPEITGDDSR